MQEFSFKKLPVTLDIELLMCVSPSFLLLRFNNCNTEIKSINDQVNKLDIVDLFQYVCSIYLFILFNCSFVFLLF